MYKNIFKTWNSVYFDRSEQDLSDVTIKISNTVDSYDEKTAENYRNCYVAENRIVSKH